MVKPKGNSGVRLLLTLLVASTIVVGVITAMFTLQSSSSSIASIAPLPRKQLFIGRLSDLVLTPPVTAVLETRNNEASAAKSSWSILGQNVSVGGQLHILLTTRDRRGNRRTKGGDLFNAVLRSGTKKSLASVTGKVEDFSNGSYLITFVPLSSGPATVRIELWMTSRLIEMTKTAATGNYVFLCVFDHTKAGFHLNYVGPPARKQLLPKLEAALKDRQSHVGVCHMDWQNRPARSNTSCSMPFPSHYHWHGICDGPRARNSTSCVSLPYCVYHNSMASNNDRQLTTIRENTGMVSGGVKSVMVLKRINDINRDENLTKEPRACKPQPYVKADGYWLREEWVNRDCSFHCNSQDKWWQCLSGKDLHFIGDSTIRQLFTLLLSSVGIKVPSSFVPPSLANTFLKKYNATVRYSHHGPPVMTSNTVNFSGASVSADRIDAIPALGNEMLVLSTIHHLVALSPEAFQ